MLPMRLRVTWRVFANDGLRESVVRTLGRLSLQGATVRLTSIVVKDWPPIRRFEIEDLSDVVVVPGPNGVGKTRLLARIMEYLSNPQGYPSYVATIEDTSEEERTACGASALKSRGAERSPTLPRHAALLS